MRRKYLCLLSWTWGVRQWGWHAALEPIVASSVPAEEDHVSFGAGLHLGSAPVAKVQVTLFAYFGRKPGGHISCA